MVEERPTWAELSDSVWDKAGSAATDDEIREALVLTLAEFVLIEREVYSTERKEFTSRKREWRSWARRYQKLFQELPSLMEGIKGVVSSLNEDVLFTQAPAEVQDIFSNRKEGLEIICRMLERLPQRQGVMDKIASDGIKGLRLKRLRSPTQSYIAKLDPLTDPQKGPSSKLVELLEDVENKEEKVRDENYYINRELRQKTEELKQAVAGFLRDYLIPVIDGLERGIWDEEELKRPLSQYQVKKELTDKWFAAYQKCYRFMKVFVKKTGLRRLRVKRGNEFDPQWHMALGHDTCAELKDDRILEVVRSGWNYYHFPIRSAEVIVVRNDGGEKDEG